MLWYAILQGLPVPAQAHSFAAQLGVGPVPSVHPLRSHCSCRYSSSCSLHVTEQQRNIQCRPLIGIDFVERADEMRSDSNLILAISWRLGQGFCGWTSPL